MDRRRRGHRRASQDNIIYEILISRCALRVRPRARGLRDGGVQHPCAVRFYTFRLDYILA